MDRGPLVAKRRAYSDDGLGPTMERLMSETGLTYRALADKTELSAGYLNHIVHGNRPVPSNDVLARLAESVAEELSAAGHQVLLDDRDARPGEKFADADLLGCPFRVTVGKKSLDDGAVDARRRGDGTDARVPHASVIDWIGHD
jgi:prolyl-tRNA synthetase